MAEWPLTPDGQYYKAVGELLIPVDGRGMAMIMVKPDGSMVGSGFTAIEQGPPGQPAVLDLAPDVTWLEPGDPTADSYVFEEITPPTLSTPGVYRAVIVMHKPEKGEDGDTVLDPDDFEDVAVGKVIAVNADEDDFELVLPKIPEVFYPASISNVGSGNANATVAEIPIPSRPWARRVSAEGFGVVTGESADVRVNLLARLNNAASGNIVARCVGVAQTERLSFSGGKPIEAGTVADGYDQIAAGASATLYIRTERSAGSVTYTASASNAQYRAVTLPL